MKRSLFIMMVSLGAVLMLAGCLSFKAAGDVQSTTGDTAPQPTRVFSDQALAIATINATPEHPAPAQVEVAAADQITVTYDPALVAEGQAQFMLCAACHNADARGIVGLGKDLTNSDFLRGLSDADAVAFITTGRPIWDPTNTTGVDMPPKGGNPALNGDQILAIVAYLRTLDPMFNVVLEGSAPAEDTSASAPAEPVVEAEPAAVEVAAVPETTENTAASEMPAAESASAPVDEIVQGEALFTATCSACHGMDGHGIQGLGKDLVASDFVHGLNDTDLLTFIKTGRPMWDAANTTGVDMPPKGGNPMLTDEDILCIIAYLRDLSVGG